MAERAPTWSDESGPAGEEEPASDVTSEQAGRYVGPGGGEPALLGRGGMGAVLLVYDRHLAREVARKELAASIAARGPSSGSGSSPTLVDRFLREARVTARLEHPNIVPVYEIGRSADGALYYTMRRIRGRSLADAIESAPSPQARLALLPHFLAVCNAVAFAHSRGVVHRDLKPANIMVGEFGETLVVDWGIARLLGDARPDVPAPAVETLLQDIGETRVGAVIGTPAYMSPEQAQGAEVTPRSDVWSLGAVLHELLTGRSPYEGDPRTTLARAVLGFVPPIRLDPGVPAELAAVAWRAMAAAPEDRYATALDLAADIGAYLDGRRVAAYTYRPRDALRLFGRMYRVPLALAGVAALVSLVVGAAAFVRVRAERDRAVAAEVATAEALEEARLRGLVARAAEAVARGDHGAALALERAVYAAGDGKTGGAAAAEAFRLIQEGAGLHTLPVSDGPVADVRWALGGELVVALTEDGAVSAWRVATGERALLLPYDDVTQMVIRSDTEVLVVREPSGAPGEVERWDLRTGAKFGGWTEGADEGVRLVALSPDGGRLAIAHFTLRVYDVATGRLLWRMERDPSQWQVNAVGWAQGGQTLLVGISGLQALKVLDGASGAVRASLSTTGSVWALDVSADGERAAVAGGGGWVYAWELSTSRPLLAAREHESRVAAVAFDGDGGRLAAQSLLGRVVVWSTATGAREASVEPGSDGESVLRWTRTGELLVATPGHVAALVSPRTGQVRAASVGALGPVTAVALHEGRLAVAAGDGRVRIGVIPAEGVRAHLAAAHLTHVRASMGLAVASDGRAVVGLADGTAQVFPSDGAPVRGDGAACRLGFIDGGGTPVVLHTPSCAVGHATWFSGPVGVVLRLLSDPPRVLFSEPPQSPPEHSNNGGAAALSLGAGFAAWARLDGTVGVGDTRSGRVWTAAPVDGRVDWLEFLDGGRVLAGQLSESERAFALWSTSDGRLITTVGEGDFGYPLGGEGPQLLAPDLEHGTLQRWEIEGTALPPLPGLVGAGVSARAPGVTVLGDDAGRIRVVSDTGGAPVDLRTGEGEVRALAITADGARFARGSGDVVTVHDTTTGALLQRVSVKTPRHLRFAVDGMTLWIVGDEVVLEVPTPAYDAARIIEASGAATNLRPCPDTFDVVPVVPYPSVESTWAPPESCERAPDVGD